MRKTSQRLRCHHQTDAGGEVGGYEENYTKTTLSPPDSFTERGGGYEENFTQTTLSSLD